MTLRHRLFWFTTLLCLGIDRLTKLWVVTHLPLDQVRPLWPGVLDLAYITNTGAAFSLFTHGSSWLRWLSLGVSLGLAAWAVWGPPLNRWEQVGLGCILGGAVGNGIDRFVTGRVIDFLDVYWLKFPVFNVADVVINVGIGCMLIAALQKPRPRS